MKWIMNELGAMAMSVGPTQAADVERSMAIPSTRPSCSPVLELAAEREQRGRVADRVADEFGLSAEERETRLPSGRQRVLNNRIHWAKFYMSKAGLISSPARGRFVATEEARKLLATNPDQINVALLMKWPSFREFYKTERTSLR